MTILFLNHWGKYPGGAEYSLLDILLFSTRTLDIHLVTTEEGFLCDRAGEAGIRCHVIKNRRSVANIRRDDLIRSLLSNIPSLFSFFLFSVRVRYLVWKVKPCCIHANVPKSHALLFLLKIMGYRGRAVFHLREIFEKGSAAQKLNSLILRGKNSAVIAISQAVRNSLAPETGAKATVIYNGVAIGGYRKKRASGYFDFVFIGRIVPWKGCHFLVEAFRRLRLANRGAQVRLTMAGSTFYWSSSYRRELMQMIERNGLSGDITLLEHQDDPFSLFAQSDLFCCASTEEPFGRAVAEAQGCGLPVIAFNSGGIPEIVINNVSGILTPSGNPDSFYKAMEYCMYNPQRAREMGTEGLKRAEKYFNREKQLPMIVKAITEN